MEQNLKKRAIFSLTQFQGTTQSILNEDQFIFTRTEFQGYADFTDAVFNGNANFSETNFKSDADFNDTKFLDQGSYNFAEARFHGDAKFRGAHFQGSANFWRTKFKSDADFLFTKFQDHSCFNFAEFERRVTFYGRDYIHRWDRNVFEEQGDFEFITFHEPEKVTFDKINLSNCFFLNTDFSRVDFRDVQWDDNPLKRRAVRDEWDGQYEWSKQKNDWVKKDKPTPPDFKRVEQLYCDLRKNYEGKLRYHEAGDFHIGQMEMRRLDPDTDNEFVKKLAGNSLINILFYQEIRDFKWKDFKKEIRNIDKNRLFYKEIGDSWRTFINWLPISLFRYLFKRLLSPIAFYKWFSRYGTSYWRPLGWLGGLILGFAFLYLFTGINTSFSEAIWFSVDRCFLNFLRFNANYEPVGWSGQLLPRFESLLGPVLIALLILAVRWNFKR